MLKRIVAKLASVKLTLWLLALLALAAAVGTLDVIPQEFQHQNYIDRFGYAGKVILWLGLDRFHYSLPYRFLFCALLLNLMACGMQKSISGLKSCLGGGIPAARVPLLNRETAREALAEAGFEVSDKGEIRAKRRLWAFSGFALVHLSPILIAAGAFIGTEVGFVGTTNAFVGTIVDQVRDWRTGEQVFLPFAVEVGSFKRLWHPLKIRLEVKTDDGVDRGQVEVMEGEVWQVPSTDYKVMVEKFDPDEAEIAYSVFESDRPPTRYSRKTMENAPVRLSPEAFMGSVRRVEADVVFYGKDSTVLSRGTLAVNEPATALGHRVYVTAWGDDGAGKPFIGMQISYDPGQLPMWFGAISLTLGVCVLLFVEGAWVREEGGELVGRSTRNRREFAALLARASGSGE